MLDSLTHKFDIYNFRLTMESHYRSWIILSYEEKLQEEFENHIVFSQNEIDILKKYSIVTKDVTIKNRVFNR